VSDILSMSPRELSRAEVMQQLKAQRITQRQAADQLGLSERQVKRLWRAYRAGGAKALLSRRRGRPSNHQLDPATQAAALGLLEDRYADFGPTLAHEKLTEIHRLVLSVETVRKLMTTAHLWHPRRAKAPVDHPPRPRRRRRGELVQIDGSPFAWFEDRSPDCSLLVYIDDATGELLELFFTPSETTFSYFAATRRYLARHGRPVAFYSDKHSIFRLTKPGATSATGLTQFGRAMTDLDIEIICANSPQAKGRVERVNQTLQDRLVKELRLRGLSDPDRANAYLPEYLTDFNRRFALPPADPTDAHRPLLAHQDLDQIFTLQTPRTLTQTLTFQYDKVVYQLVQPRRTRAFRGAKVLVLEAADGSLAVEYRGRPLAFTRYAQHVSQADEVSSKALGSAVDAALRRQTIPKPAANHPWRRYGTPLTEPRPAGRAAPPGAQPPPMGGG
jgi:hypothetical protein